MDLLTDNKWIDDLGHPLIISGPCSAESEQQMLTIAHQLKALPLVKIFRAGIWKPRTLPNQFEGVGEKGLSWLQRVKEETGLMTAVEVAHPRHVEQCLKAGIDIIWIGARTVGNPFSMHELSEALRGADIPVMVKNPPSPDLNSWIGALERVNSSGITKLLAVHRGFFISRRSLYRNTPLWEIVIELKRMLPEIRVICDPSHISGNRKYIWEIAQKALDLEMDGLMIESHHHPEHALTDANQQITPEHLKEGLKKLIIRERKIADTPEKDLSALRAGIDSLDHEMIELLSQRMEIIRNIARIKKEHDITILQLDRWSELIFDRIENGIKHGLKKEFIMRFLQVIHQEAIDLQSKIINRKDL